MRQTICRRLDQQDYAPTLQLQVLLLLTAYPPRLANKTLQHTLTYQMHLC